MPIFNHKLASPVFPDKNIGEKVAYIALFIWNMLITWKMLYAFYVECHIRFKAYLECAKCC